MGHGAGLGSNLGDEDGLTEVRVGDGGVCVMSGGRELASGKLLAAEFFASRHWLFCLPRFVALPDRTRPPFRPSGTWAVHPSGSWGGRWAWRASLSHDELHR